MDSSPVPSSSKKSAFGLRTVTLRVKCIAFFSPVGPRTSRKTKTQYFLGFLSIFRMSLDGVGSVYGGEGGIRTPDTRKGMADFESAAFNRALPPLRSAADTLFSLPAKDPLSNT